MCYNRVYLEKLGIRGVAVVEKVVENKSSVLGFDIVKFEFRYRDKSGKSHKKLMQDFFAGFSLSEGDRFELFYEEKNPQNIAIIGEDEALIQRGYFISIKGFRITSFKDLGVNTKS